MNLNLDGSELTTEQLLDFAREAGCDMKRLLDTCVSLHSGSSIRSHLLFVTTNIRFQAWGEGRLNLRTRLWGSSDRQPRQVDEEMFDFLVSTVRC